MPTVTVTHTLTSAFCPFADQIIADIEGATVSVEGVDKVEIITTFDPEFGPDMMSEDAKMILGNILILDKSYIIVYYRIYNNL